MSHVAHNCKLVWSNGHSIAFFADRNDFHISSESYGGHYMPELAEEILKRNDQARIDQSVPVINFAGFLVGNPYTDARSNEVLSHSQVSRVNALRVSRVSHRARHV